MKRPLYIIILALVFSCSKEDSGDSNSTDSKQEYSTEIAGALAKGAYKAGSDITFYELNDNLSQTGKSFSTNTSDDYGTFSLSVESITENYARVEGNGYYWNEITNSVTEEKLRLNAICEVNEEINLNILTHLEYDRVIELVQNQGKTFEEAKSQALSEVLSSFGLEYDANNGNAEVYNFNKADDSSKILLLVSVAILHNNTQSEISSLISNITNDIKDDGLISSTTIYKKLIDNLIELSDGQSINFNTISQNVYEFYENNISNLQLTSFNILDLSSEAIEKLKALLPDQDNDGIPDLYDLCSETPEGENVNSNGCHDFIYISENTLTVKARETANIGDTREINGVEYTVVDRDMLVDKIKNKEDLVSLVTTFVNDMNRLFLDNDKEFNQDISGWDTSNVTNFNATFAQTANFNQNISFWDVSSVEDFTYMFAEAQKFNQDLSRWCVESAISFEGFSVNAVSFEESNLPQWGRCPLSYDEDKDDDGVPDTEDQCPDTRKGVAVDSSGCEINPLYLDENGITVKADLTYAVIGETYELNGLNYKVVDRSILDEMIANNEDVSQVVTSYINDMSGLFKGKTYFNDDISSWDTSNVESFEWMFNGAKVFNQDIGKWDTSNVTSLAATFYQAERFNQNINNWDVSNVTNIWRLFADAYKFNQPLNNWNISNVTEMISVFRNARDFNQDINSWDTSNVTDMSNLFQYALSFNYSLNNWNTSKVTTMYQMFYRAISFNSDISSWDVSNVQDFSFMFTVEDYYTFGKAEFNQDLNSWNVSRAENMQSMFQNTKFNKPLNNWNVSSVNNMRAMFYNNNSFNQDLSSWDVSNVYECGGFSIIDDNENSNWTEPKPNFTNCDPDEF
jgi:surface protein